MSCLRAIGIANTALLLESCGLLMNENGIQEGACSNKQLILQSINPYPYSSFFISNPIIAVQPPGKTKRKDKNGTHFPHTFYSFHTRSDPCGNVSNQKLQG